MGRGLARHLGPAGQDPNGSGPLRQVLEASGVSLSDGTVLAPANDPYRQDTPAGHREGQWFAEQFAAAGKSQIHLRGLHYAIVVRGNVRKPNGKPYTNTDEDWVWLQIGPAKAARWLGYVPFSAIVDQRSDAPVCYHADHADFTESWVEAGVEVYLPTDAAIEPSAHARGFGRRQPYQLVIFGEKASLADVVLPIANIYGADAYLETGEISDSHLYGMARRNAEDGRPLRVFTVADFDPAGWQMPVSIGRKLQALRDLEFPAMDFEVRPVALLVEHVRDLQLPSTPLKESEKRAEKWRQRWGHEQTEVDALVTLRPDVLDTLLVEAVELFFDSTLARRLEAAARSWQEQAQQWLRDQIDHQEFTRLRTQANTALTSFRKRINTINAGLRHVTTNIELPEIVVPNARVDVTAQRPPLVASTWSWLAQTRALKARKSYE